MQQQIVQALSQMGVSPKAVTEQLDRLSIQPGLFFLCKLSSGTLSQVMGCRFLELPLNPVSLPIFDRYRMYERLTLVPGISISQHVRAHWSQLSHAYKDFQITPEEKTAIREAILPLLGAPESKIRTAAVCGPSSRRQATPGVEGRRVRHPICLLRRCRATSMAVASIAQWDYEDWPQLIQTLFACMGSGDLNAVHGAVRCLDLLIDSLSQQQISESFFAALLAILRAPQNYNHIILMRAVSIMCSLFKILGTAALEHPDVVKGWMARYFDEVLAMVVQIMAAPLPPDGNCSLKTQAIRLCTVMAEQFPALLRKRKAASQQLFFHVWAAITTALQIYDEHIVRGRGIAAPPQVDEEGDILTFPTYVMALTQFLVVLIRSRKFAPALQGALEPTMRLMVGFLQIAPDQEQAWANDTNEYLRDEDEDSYSWSLRLAVLEVIQLLVEHFDQEALRAAVGAIGGSIQAATAARRAGDPHWWRPHEAAVRLVSSLAEDLVQANEDGPMAGDLDDVLQTLSQATAPPRPASPADRARSLRRAALVHRGGAATVPKKAAPPPGPLFPVEQFRLAALQLDPDICARYPFLEGRILQCAASLCEGFPMEATLGYFRRPWRPSRAPIPPATSPRAQAGPAGPHAPVIFQFATQYAVEASEEELHLMLDTLLATMKRPTATAPCAGADVQVGGESLGAHAAALTDALLRIWEEHMNDPFLSSSLADLFEARLTPVLVGLIESANSPPGCAEAAVDLITVIAGPRATAQPLGAGQFAPVLPEQAFGCLTRLMLTGHDDGSLQSAAMAMRRLVRLYPAHIRACTGVPGVQLADPSGVGALIAILRRYLDAAELDDSAALYVGPFITAAVQTFAAETQPQLGGLMEAVVVRLSSAQLSTLIQVARPPAPHPTPLEGLVLALVQLMRLGTAPWVDALAAIRVPPPPPPEEGQAPKPSPLPPAQDGLTLVLQKWARAQNDFRGDYSLKVSVWGLVQLFRAADPRLDGVQVLGDIVPTDRITTRRQAATNPDRWTVVPFRLKAVKLVLKVLEEELINRDPALQRAVRIPCHAPVAGRSSSGSRSHGRRQVTGERDGEGADEDDDEDGDEDGDEEDDEEEGCNPFGAEDPTADVPDFAAYLQQLAAMEDDGQAARGEEGDGDMESAQADAMLDPLSKEDLMERCLDFVRSLAQFGASMTPHLLPGELKVIETAMALPPRPQQTS
ncbi:putative armadillo-type protein [Paratrimastix pyriformis]|uniref:Armadillo-type protein n=1 Tax=Paratrimastix pyriformis TaxID=342808 RepID=A0ABQ8URK1_9EUKA|nr:putative armadillo-type protein [Paratrimastix pyriformis]